MKNTFLNIDNHLNEGKTKPGAKPCRASSRHAESAASVDPNPGAPSTGAAIRILQSIAWRGKAHAAAQARRRRGDALGEILLSHFVVIESQPPTRVRSCDER
jgi:hypothetical protein